MRKLDAKIIDLVAENPGITRPEVARKLGISYYTAREHLDKLFLSNILEREYVARRGVPVVYFWRYYIKRRSRKVVLSFRFTRELAKRKPRKMTFTEELLEGKRRERLIEIIVEVDKPVFINVEPEYVLVTLLDHSAWAFSIGTRLAMRTKRVAEFPGRYFWRPEFVEKPKFPIVRVKPLSPEISKVNVGSTDELPSKFKRGEFYVRITYTDYQYPRNSFTREMTFFDFLEKWKKGHVEYQKGLRPRGYIEHEIKKQLYDWIVRVCNEEFAWWTPKWVAEKYGAKWE